MTVFFSDSDRAAYLEILKEQSNKSGLKIWAYCLMDNHVHLVAVPETKESLACAIGETHKRYTRMVNLRNEWKGYLWQGRFHSCPLDEAHVWAAVRYVEQNPVAAGVVEKAEDYLWSSAKAHVYKKPDSLLSHCFLNTEVIDWAGYLRMNSAESPRDEFNQTIEKYAGSGRPLGGPDFIQRLEAFTGRNLKTSKPGRKPFLNRDTSLNSIK